MKKKLIIVLDAFPFEKIKEKKMQEKHLNLNIINFQKLETIPGYSDGIYPSIWTGLNPAQTNFWSPFKFIENKNKETKKKDEFLKTLYPLLKNIPYKINPFASFALCTLFEKILKKKYPFPPFYNFSLDQLFFYDNYQDYIMNPKKFNIHQSSIFSILREKLIKFDYIFTYEFGAHYKKRFEKSCKDVIFYLNPILDLFGHKYGPNSTEYNDKLISLLDWLNRLILEDKFDLIIFSDHGMTYINDYFQPIPIFRHLNLKLNKDVIIWLDSTMVRIWLWSEKAKREKDKIISKFMDQSVGLFYDSPLRKKYGLDFHNRVYGDLIFQVDPHYEVFPNYYHYLRFPPSKGMHGYIPTHKDSYGIFYSNQNNLEKPKSVLNIFDYLKKKIL